MNLALSISRRRCYTSCNDNEMSITDALVGLMRGEPSDA
jgi:hypothetical protein